MLSVNHPPLPLSFMKVFEKFAKRKFPFIDPNKYLQVFNKANAVTLPGPICVTYPQLRLVVLASLQASHEMPPFQMDSRPLPC